MVIRVSEPYDTMNGGSFLSGWWFMEHENYFPIDWEFHHPKFRSYFSEELKPPTSHGCLGTLRVHMTYS